MRALLNRHINLFAKYSVGIVSRDAIVNTHCRSFPSKVPVRRLNIELQMKISYYKHTFHLNCGFRQRMDFTYSDGCFVRWTQSEC